MIPTFLQSLATQVRALVASGKALHVTNQTAEELELLAGLTWPAPLDRRCEVRSGSAGSRSCGIGQKGRAVVSRAKLVAANRDEASANGVLFRRLRRLRKHSGQQVRWRVPRQ